MNGTINLTERDPTPPWVLAVIIICTFAAEVLGNDAGGCIDRSTIDLVTCERACGGTGRIKRLGPHECECYIVGPTDAP